MALFVKGQSGNPGGRPKGVERSFRDEIAAARVIDPELGEVDGWTAARQRLIRIMRTGEDKDAIAAIKLLYERAYGRPKEQVDMTVSDVTEDHRRMLDALRMTPHERRKAIAEEDAPEVDDAPEDDGLVDL